MAAALSPDGRTVAIDLLGALWTYDAAGGPARRMLDDGYDARLPAWSPDGRRLAFQAYHRDTWHLWTVERRRQRPAAGHLRAVRRPRAALVARRHAAGVLVRSQRPLRHLDRHRSPRRGDPTHQRGLERVDAGVVARRPRHRLRVGSAGPRHLRRSRWPAAPNAGSWPMPRRWPAPAWTPDGTAVAYTAVDGAVSRLIVAGKNIADAGEDVFPFRAAVRRERRDPLHRRRRGEAAAGGRRRGAHGAVLGRGRLHPGGVHAQGARRSTRPGRSRCAG